MRKTIIFIFVAFLLVFCAAPVYANDILPLPHAFCGNVTINDSSAPVNTTVEARGNGVTTGVEGNPITVTEEGKFGSPEPLGQKLIVKGDIANGTKISFLVNGTYTGTTFDFKSGETTVLDLNLAITATSITGEVKEIIPSNQTGYVVDASTIANTTITVSTTGVVTITTKKYSSNPHPEVTLPATMLPRYIDIEVDNPDAIVWPMYVEQTYTDAEVAGLDESTLGMYYFKDADNAWHRCSDTGVNTAANYVWANMTRAETSGSPVALGGTAAAPAPPPTPAAGGGAPPLPAGTTDVRGMVTAAGRFTTSVTATSEDGLCKLIIPKGTIGLTKDLKPLTMITMVILDKPPSPPKDAHIIGLAYDFKPDGATFDPEVTLEYTYNPAKVPEDVPEEDLVVAWYDAGTGKWEVCECTCDPEANCVTACVCHFTTFAIIGRAPAPAPPAPAPPAPAPVPPAPAPPAPAPAPPAPAPPAPAPTPPPPKPPAPTPPAPLLPPAPEGINWPIVGGVIAAVIVVGLIVFFLVRRRAY